MVIWGITHIEETNERHLLRQNVIIPIYRLGLSSIAPKYILDLEVALIGRADGFFTFIFLAVFALQVCITYPIFDI